MPETYVCLEFFCAHCQNPIRAKLHCSGEGVGECYDTAAQVSIHCPDCTEANKVLFDLGGQILDVKQETHRLFLEPSLN